MAFIEKHHPDFFLYLILVNVLMYWSKLDNILSYLISELLPHNCIFLIKHSYL